MGFPDRSKVRRASGALLLAAAALALAPRPGWAAQDPGYHIEAWSADQGLPSDAVYGVAQTPDGYLWVATNAGLARFDGVRFTVFNHRNTPALQSDGCGSLLVDHDGALWISTVGGGMTRLDREGRFTPYGREEGLSFEYGAQLFEDREGRLWVGTNERLHVFRNGRFETVGPADGIPDPRANPSFQDAEGGIWFYDPTGVGRLKDGVFVRMPSPSESPIPSAIGRLFRPWPGRNGEIWISRSNPVSLLRVRGDAVASFDVSPTSPTDGIKTLLVTERGDTWVGLARGGARVVRDGKVLAITEKDGLPTGTVSTIVADREGNVWIGTHAGLARVKRKTFAVLSARDALPDDRTWAVYEDRRGDVWIGTETDLARIHEGAIRSYGMSDGLPSRGVVSMVEDHLGRMWFGTTAGLVRFEEDRFVTLTSRDGLSGDNVRALFEDRQGRLWVGTSAGGVSVLEDGAKIRVITSREGLAGNWVDFIHQDVSGDLWICTRGGVSRIHEGVVSSFTVAQGLPDDHVLTMHEDATGALWFGTYRGGLCRLKDGRFGAITSANGLPDDTILRILEDERGNFWMSSSRGIFRTRRADLEAFLEGQSPRVWSVTYGKTDGLPTTDCGGGTQPSGWKARDGRLWFPTSRGIVIVDPSTVEINSLPPPVVVEQVTHDGVREDAAPRATFAAGTKNVEFRYTALSFTAPEKVRFRFRLEGLDNDWTDAGSLRVAHFSHIPPGSYRFRVTAANNDGFWNETGATYEVRLLPYFYQTSWFFGACALAGAAALGGAHRLRLRQAEARYVAVLTERARIARELHDTVAQGFAGVSMQLEALSTRLDQRGEGRENLDRARLLIRSSLADARRSVRDLRPVLLESGDLVSSLGATASALTAGTTTSAEVRVKGRPRGLARDVEDQLFRVAQEALTNALRHGGCRRVRLLVAYHRRRIELVVEDDGCGFPGTPPPSTQGGGFGLVGMKERMARIGGRLEIDSEPGRGTRIRAEAPMKRGLRGWLEIGSERSREGGA